MESLQQLSLFEDNGATFSPDRRYRYKLWRIWDAKKPLAMFIGLNPSTADENEDDPTIRRCIGFALNNWGYGGIFMVNLFGYRATNPRELRETSDPIGPDNNSWLTSCVSSCSRIVAGWGTGGGYLNRDRQVMDLLLPAMDQHERGWPLCFGITKDGYPKHPLYLPKLAGLIVYKGRKHGQA